MNPLLPMEDGQGTLVVPLCYDLRIHIVFVSCGDMIAVQLASFKSLFIASVGCGELIKQ
jgi:hypothetical protein